MKKLASTGCTQYIGVDVSEGACGRAQARLSECDAMNGEVIVGDAFGDDMMKIVSSLIPFTQVNCQFALHYCFGNEESARAAFRVVACALRNGGRFFGTVANGDVLDVRRRHLGRRFGDRYFKVAFEREEATDFGDAYAFTFHGAVENLTEFATRRTTFTRLAEEAGFTVELWENMATFAARKSHDHTELWEAMQCSDIVDVTKMYAVFSCTRQRS